MRNLSKILAFIIMSIFIIGCSINEEITVNSNGNIKYSYLLDAGDFMKIMPDSTGQKKTINDSVFSFANILKEKKDSIAKLPLETQKKLYALKPFSVKIHQDGTKKEFTIQLFGDFDNITSLNSALTSLTSINQGKSQGVSEENLKLLTNVQYSWDGTNFRKKILNLSQENDSVRTNLTTMFNGGSFNTKYNFPKKIKKVNNPDAIISADKKTVTIKYNAAEYIMNPEKNNIEIELEK